MGFDVKSWDYWRMCRLYLGPSETYRVTNDTYRIAGGLGPVPEWLRDGLWIWRDEFEGQPSK